MGLGHAMRALAAEWDDLRGHLRPDQCDTLDELVTEFAAEADPALSAEIAEEIADLLGGLLPDEHPFRRALASPESRFTSGDQADLTEWRRPVGELRLLVAGERIVARATARLLSAPSVGEWDLVARGQDPTAADLIRLDRRDGTVQWPAFQFGADGAPLAVVTTINRILDAADDPWGVADWWLGRNAWLGAVPSQLLERERDQELIDTARAERSEANDA
jgi:hypothetical protein